MPILNPSAIVTVGTAVPSAPDLDAEAEFYAREIAAARAGFVGVDPDGRISERLNAPEGLDLSSEGARLAVYRALGLAVHSVNPTLAARARALSGVLAIVGTGEAPAEFSALADDLVESWMAGRGSGLEAWMLALEAVMSVTAPTERGGSLASGDAGAVAAAVVHRLRGSVVRVPPGFENPSAEVLANAGGWLLESRIRRHGRPGTRAKLLSPWGAAKEFAAFFGIEMPEKRDTERDRKTTRRRRRNTAR